MSAWKLESSYDGGFELIPSALPDRSNGGVGYSSAVLITREHQETLWIVPDGGGYSYMDALNRAEMIVMDLRHQVKENPVVKGTRRHAHTSK